MPVKAYLWTDGRKTLAFYPGVAAAITARGRQDQARRTGDVSASGQSLSGGGQ